MLNIKLKLEDQPDKIHNWKFDESQSILEQHKAQLSNLNIPQSTLYHLYNTETKLFILEAKDLKTGILT
jgi:hypothetical protein